MLKPPRPTDRPLSAIVGTSGIALDRVVVVTAIARSLPDLPAIAEAGGPLASFDVNTWFGLFGPGGLPAAQLRQLNKAFVDALHSPELKVRLSTLMAESIASTPEQFSAFVKSENAKYERVVKASGATVE